MEVVKLLWCTPVVTTGNVYHNCWIEVTCNFAFSCHSMCKEVMCERLVSIKPQWQIYQTTQIVNGLWGPEGKRNSRMMSFCAFLCFLPHSTAASMAPNKVSYHF